MPEYLTEADLIQPPQQDFLTEADLVAPVAKVAGKSKKKKKPAEPVYLGEWQQEAESLAKQHESTRQVIRATEDIAKRAKPFQGGLASGAQTETPAIVTPMRRGYKRVQRGAKKEIIAPTGLPVTEGTYAKDAYSRHPEVASMRASTPAEAAQLEEVARLSQPGFRTALDRGMLQSNQTLKNFGAGMLGLVDDLGKAIHPTNFVGEATEENLVHTLARKLTESSQEDAATLAAIDKNYGSPAEKIVEISRGLPGMIGSVYLSTQMTGNPALGFAVQKMADARGRGITDPGELATQGILGLAEGALFNKMNRMQMGPGRILAQGAAGAAQVPLEYRIGATAEQLEKKPLPDFGEVVEGALTNVGLDIVMPGSKADPKAGALPNALRSESTLPAFKFEEMRAMEDRAVAAGRPLAFTPERVAEYQTRNTELKQRLFTADPASPEFARLSDEYIQLAKAIEDAPETPPQSIEELRQHLLQKNLGHEGAVQEMLDLLQPAEIKSGLEFDPERFEKARQSDLRGARFYPLDSNPAKGGTVYLTPQTFEDVGLIDKGQRSQIGAINVSLDDAWASAARIQDTDPAAAAALAAAVKEAETKGLPKVSIISYVEGQGLAETRKLMRHESFHTGQEAAAVGQDIIGIDPRNLHPREILYHPVLDKVARTESGQTILNYYEGDPDSLALEIAAYSSAGQHDYIGLTAADAATYLTDYLTGIAEEHGPDALDRLAGSARLRPKVEAQVKEIASEYRSKQQQLGKGNRDFAALLRGRPLASGRSEGSEGRSDGGAGLVEGGTGQGTDQGPVGGMDQGPPADPGVGAVGLDPIIDIEGIPHRVTVYRTSNYVNRYNVRGVGTYYFVDKPPTQKGYNQSDIDPGKTLKVNNKVQALLQLGVKPETILSQLEIDNISPQILVEQATKGTLPRNEYDSLDKLLFQEGKKAGYDTLQFTQEPDATGKRNHELVDLREAYPKDFVHPLYGKDWAQSENTKINERYGSGGIGATGADPPNIYTTVLSSDAVKQIAKKAGDVLKVLGIPENPLLPPHEQIMKALKDHPDKATPEAIGAAMRQLGLDGKDLVEAVDEASKHAGQLLRNLQDANAKWDRAIKENPKWAIKMAKTGAHVFGLGPSPKETLQKGLANLEASELGRTWWQRSGDLYRKMLLSRFSTAAVNSITTTFRLPLDLIDGVVTGVVIGALNPKKYAGKSDATIAEAAKEGAIAGAQATMQVALAFPDMAKRLLKGGIKPISKVAPKMAESISALETPVMDKHDLIISQMLALHPKLHSELTGLSTGIDILEKSKVDIEELKTVLPYLNDAKASKEFEARLDLMQKRYNANVSVLGKAFNKTGWVLDKFMKPNTVQEFFSRRPYFVGALVKRAKDAGYDLYNLIENTKRIEDFSKDPTGQDVNEVLNLQTLANLPPEVWEGAADDALTFTYAYKPKKDRGVVENLYATWIESMQKLGLAGAIIDAFPKATYNGLKFAYEYSPLGMLKPTLNIVGDAREGGREAVKADDVSRMVKGGLGMAMFATALYIRKEHGGEEWYQIKTGKKDKKGQPIYMNVKKYMPFAGMLYLADVSLRAKEGRLFEIKTHADDMAELYLNARRADNGGAAFFDLTKEMMDWMDTGAPLKDKTKAAAARPLANVLGAPLTLLVNLRDMVAQFDEDEAARRDQKGAPILGPAIDKIPWLRSSEKYGLPLTQPPTEQAPRPFSAAPGLTWFGVNLDPGSNFATREFARLGLSPIRWLRPHPDTTINKAQYAAYAEILSELGPAIEADINYQQANDKDKATYLEALLSGVDGFAGVAKQIGEQANPQYVEMEKLRQTQKPLMRKSTGLDKAIQEMKNASDKK